MRSRCDHKNQSGFSIIEAMISLSIGLILLIGMTQAFVGSKKTYRLQENLVHLQENGRFAIRYITDALHMAGYKDQLTTITNPINGIEDLVEIDKFEVGFEATTNLCDGTAIGLGIETTFKFYIGKVSDTNYLYCDDDDGISDAVELAENVENMEILYGEDTDADGTANIYVDADVVTDMNDVVSVRIHLLFRSEDELTSAPQPYIFAGLTYIPTKKYIYRTFTTTVRLRNRGI